MTLKAKQVIRVNVSVPKDVKKEMDAKADHVNWSAVATEAFRAKLLELKSQGKADTMTEVIERLKAAKELEDNEQYEAGHEAGTDWAKETATPRVLQRLSAGTQDPRFFHGQPDAWGWAGVLFRIATGHHDIDRHECDSFWEEALGEDHAGDIYDGDFAHGFVVGAVEIWDKVKDEI